MNAGDARQFSICNLREDVVAGEGQFGFDCDPTGTQGPWSSWTLITNVANQTSGSNIVAATRGAVLRRLRWQYNITLGAAPGENSGSTDSQARVVAALVISPVDSFGSPYVDPVTGTLPVLFSGSAGIGDLPFPGIRVLWRSMRCLSLKAPTGTTEFQTNITGWELPTHRLSRVSLKENEGLFWMYEAVNASSSPHTYNLTSNVTMAYRIRTF